jgi:hypothetical protein
MLPVVLPFRLPLTDKHLLLSRAAASEAGRICTLPPERIVADQFIDPPSELLGACRRQDWVTVMRLLDDGRLAAARFVTPAYDLYRRPIA